MRLSHLFAALVLVPTVALGQNIDPEQTVYAVSNVRNQLWTFDRNDPQPTTQAFGLQLGAMTVALDPLTNHLFVRAGGASAPAGTEYVSCVDATTLEDLGYRYIDGGCGFDTPGEGGISDNSLGAGNGSITIDPIMRVLYSDGGPTESDNCSENNPRHDSDGQVFAYSLVPANYGQLIAVIHDSDGAHWMTDGNHLTWDPTDRRLWSAPSEYTDNIRPRFIDVGTVHARGGEFGEVTITDLPTIAPASSIGVDPDNRRIFLIPWNPPTNHNPGQNSTCVEGGNEWTCSTTVAEHPEGWYVRVYDMDSYEEQEVLDYRAPPANVDSNSHCGYNIDFKLFYDRLGGFLYETNFSDERAMFYDVGAGTVTEAEVGLMLDVYGFDASLPVETYEWDHDGDGIIDTVEVGATDITIDPTGGDPTRLNDADPTNWTSPYLADTDGDGVDDGVEDANQNGRVDAGESNPSDQTDAPGQDFDRDGVTNERDNCRAVPNADQADADENGIGDVCDGSDPDRDGYPDEMDNCPCVFNPDQTDSDSDGAGDPCSIGDDDGDGALDGQDNCPCTANPDQSDSNGDGVGDLCAVDTDLDGLIDQQDNCPAVANPGQQDNCDQDTFGDACAPDMDADTVADACDNCPEVANTDQADNNNDGVGAACSPPVDTCACRFPGLATGEGHGLVLLALAGLFAACRRRGLVKH